MGNFENFLKFFGIFWFLGGIFYFGGVGGGGWGWQLRCRRGCSVWVRVLGVGGVFGVGCGAKRKSQRSANPGEQCSPPLYNRKGWGCFCVGLQCSALPTPNSQLLTPYSSFLIPNFQLLTQKNARPGVRICSEFCPAGRTCFIPALHPRAGAQPIFELGYAVVLKATSQ